MSKLALEEKLKWKSSNKLRNKKQYFISKELGLKT